MVKRQRLGWLTLGVLCLGMFIVLTLLVAFVDVDQVGLSHLNHWFCSYCGRHIVWERITDWLGYVTILVVLGLVVWQIVQWVKRKSLFRVDRNLLIWDIMLTAMVVVYLFFEIVIVNYRPELDNSVAKASYPSSHTMLFTTIFPLLIWHIWHYLKDKPLCIVFTTCLIFCYCIGIVGRLLSGVHWFTDIVAGIIMGCSFNCFYFAVIDIKWVKTFAAS